MTENNVIASEFVRYKSVISSLLSRLNFVSAPDIEDILQETYLRTYQSALQREIRFPKAFMVKTAIRLARRQSELASREVDGLELDEFEAGHDTDLEKEGLETPENGYIKLEEFRLLSTVINELPPRCRKVFIMKKIYGLSQKEIATALGLSESTVEKHIASGMLNCARAIDKLNAQSKHQQTVTELSGSRDHAERVPSARNTTP